MSDALEGVNGLPAQQARQELGRCCHSTRWVDEMVRARPFASEHELFSAAERAADMLTRSDWLEAFAGHPRIGEVSELEKRFSATADWSRAEQSGIATAPSQVLEELARENARYEERFGHVFLICASGRSPQQMLQALRERMANDPADELQVAAAEQRKITRLRLERLLR